MKHSICCLVAIAVLLSLCATARCQENTLKSFGTGFIVDGRGYILTNEHVVHRAKTVNVVLQQKDTFAATLISTDLDHDLALLKIDAPRPLPSTPIGNSSEVKRQQAVLAIGFPFGEEAVTSTSGRIVSIRKEGANQLLVTDAVVNPGNSGGPLLNDAGEAIGVIRSLLLADVGGERVKAGEIYAIPISFAMPMLAAIPDFDWRGVGAARGRLDPDEIDELVSPAVVQILSDRVQRGTIEGAAGEGEKGFSENAVALLTSYLDRMELKYEVDTSGKWPIMKLTVKMDNASHHVRIVIDAEKELVYMFLNRYLVAPQDHPKLREILQALMDYNWRVNVGKLEWDKSDGEVRFSYTFTTENGVGFEAFEAIFVTILRLGDKLWPELKKLTHIPEGEPEGDN